MRARICQHCGQAIPEIRFGARLGPIAARIFDAVQRSGADGIDPDDLFELIYADRPGRKRSALKGYVRQINYNLSDCGAPVRIYARRGHYKITSSKSPRLKEIA